MKFFEVILENTVQIDIRTHFLKEILISLLGGVNYKSGLKKEGKVVTTCLLFNFGPFC